MTKENVLSKTTTDAAPVWHQDKKFPNCVYCNTKFHVLNRRHHCRQCGKVICGKCSTGREILKNIDEFEK